MTQTTPSPDPTSTPRRRVSDLSEDELSPYGITGVAVFTIAVLVGVHWLAAWFLGIAATCLLAAKARRP